MSLETLRSCRDLLLEITPLCEDCGTLCGCACCRSLEGDATGMLLFPGEEAFYTADDNFSFVQSELGLLLFCSGHCLRENRPLSCRLFPLLPLIRGDEIKVGMDLRARAVCPLSSQGIHAMRQEMIEAVRTCGTLLAADPVQRRFLLSLTEEQDQLRQLVKRFGGR